MKGTAFVLALVFAIATVGLPGSAAAAGWVPISCEERSDEVAVILERAGDSTDFRSSWQQHEQAVRNAQPGDRDYVPHPYPKSDQEVFEDFRHAFLTRLVVDSQAVALRHRETFDALQTGKFRYEVERIENWEPTRCRWDQPVPFYHLVRLFDADGRELSRTALYESGLFAIFARLDGQQGPLDDLAKIAATVHQRFGVGTKPSRAQYVTLSGVPVQCTVVMPCVAFDSGGRTYVVNHDYYLFEIAPGAPQLSILDHVQRTADPRAPGGNAGRESTPWLTVGYGMREGRLVALGPRGVPLD